MPIRNLYGLYDILNNGICIGIFTAAEIQDKFKMSIDSFYSMVTRKMLIKHRYEIFKFNSKIFD